MASVNNPFEQDISVLSDQELADQIRTQCEVHQQALGEWPTHMNVSPRLYEQLVRRKLIGKVGVVIQLDPRYRQL